MRDLGGLRGVDLDGFASAFYACCFWRFGKRWRRERYGEEERERVGER